MVSTTKYNIHIQYTELHVHWTPKESMVHTFRFVKYSEGRSTEINLWGAQSALISKNLCLDVKGSFPLSTHKITKCILFFGAECIWLCPTLMPGLNYLSIRYSIHSDFLLEMIHSEKSISINPIDLGTIQVLILIIFTLYGMIFSTQRSFNHFCHFWSDGLIHLQTQCKLTLNFSSISSQVLTWVRVEKKSPSTKSA